MEEEITMTKSIRKRLAKDLPLSVLKQLSMHLNPRMVCGGDWMSLAGEFEMTYLEIRNYDRVADPTMAVLEKWWIDVGDKTVSRLIEILRKIKRADVVKILEPYEFYDIANDQSHPSGEEDTDPFSRLTKLPIATGFTNGDHNGFKEDSFDTASNFSVPGGRSNKPEASENFLDSAAYAIAGDMLVDTDSQDELDDVPGMFHGRGSRTNGNRLNMSVQTQVPSPIAACEAPLFPSPVAQDRQGAASLATAPPKLVAPHDKIALVIGNLHYKKEQFDKLSYTMNDAFDIAAALGELGFKVISMVDLTLTEMRTIMLAFCRLLGPGIYAVIYYAGHGYELDGENYLLPVDAMSADPNESIRAQEFLQEMQNCNTLLNLMFLDCCRTRAKDKKTPRCSLKRRTEGNTIIAYSCCTQHQAFEEPDAKNGVYARHLLQHINRDVRIERILMDVSTAVVESRSVNQRPSYESDAYLDCRLTAPIMPEGDVTKWKERYDLWDEGNRLPEEMTVDIGDAKLSLKFAKCFSNLLHIDMFITNSGRKTMKNCRFTVDLAGPVMAESVVHERHILPDNQKTHFAHIRISKLQKLYNETIFLAIDFETDDDQHLKKLDLDKPLISGITGSFHDWIKERNYDTQRGARSSWI